MKGIRTHFSREEHFERYSVKALAQSSSSSAEHSPAASWSSCQMNAHGDVAETRWAPLFEIVGFCNLASCCADSAREQPSGETARKCGKTFIQAKIIIIKEWTQRETWAKLQLQSLITKVSCFAPSPSSQLTKTTWRIRLNLSAIHDFIMFLFCLFFLHLKTQSRVVDYRKSRASTWVTKWIFPQQSMMSNTLQTSSK